MNKTQLEIFPGVWADATPLPYYHSPLKWFWLRLIGYRDTYGRKAALLPPWG